MTIRKVSYLQGSVPAPYKLPAEDHRLNHAALWLPSSALGGLRVRSGIVPGPGSPAAVAVVAGGVNINPFHVVIQGSVTSTQGVYEFVSDAVEFRAITAASATEFRRGYVIARVYDQLNPGTGTVQDLPAVEVIYGPNAASAGAATLPPLPANSLVLREFAVSNTGAITLVATSTPPWITGRGAIQPVDTADVVAPAYDGQYRDHPTRGLERGKGAAWVPPGLGPDAPYLRAIRTSAQAVGSASWSVLGLQVQEARGGWTYTGTAATVPVSGVYMVSLSASISGAVAAGRLITCLLVNGTQYTGGLGRAHYAGGGDLAVNAVGFIPLTAGQALGQNVWQDSGATQNIGVPGPWAYSGIEAVWLRP